MIKLYGYWQSSATWRVRLALELKEIEYKYMPVNLLKGEQAEAAHISRNPQALVPALETTSGAFLTQSLAIIHYLERAFPQNPLLPTDPILAAQVEAVSTMIACEAQPFGNRRVLLYLRETLGFDDDAIKTWMDRWPGTTLKAVETMVMPSPSQYAFGDQPGMADLFIIPQLYAARRFGGDVSGFSRLLEIEAACEAVPAFHAAHPFQQADRPPS